jgi:hypothetical protein
VTLDELEALLEGSEVMFLEPREVFDSAIIGLAHRVDGLHVIAYDSERIVRALMDKHGLNESDARDWYEFNTAGAYVGTGTPVFIQLCEPTLKGGNETSTPSASGSTT